MLNRIKLLVFNLKILSIDYGMKKIWTAFYDSKFWICLLWEIFFKKGDFFSYLKEKKWDLILIGIPKNNEWTNFESKKSIENFKKQLEIKLWKIKIKTIDERMTTKIAKQKIRKIWISEKKWKKIEDSLSALEILETYLIQSSVDYN